MALKKRSGGSTDRQILSDLGARLARLRLDRNLTQEQFAHEAGVSKRTVVRLEQGQSSQLLNFIRVLRALHLLEQFAAVIPAPFISPIAQMTRASQQRRRSTGKRATSKVAAPWTWGDDAATRGRP